MSEEQLTKGALRLYWIPQVPMTGFHVMVKDIEQALFLYDTLAKYDLFQLEHHIKPDYSNMGGLEVWTGTEWEEWEDDDGSGISEKYNEIAYA